jgi:hypothetical protein
MAWRWNNFQALIVRGSSQRWRFFWPGAQDVGVQYFMAHPLEVGEELVLSNQTKGTVAAVGGGVFYAVTVFNAQPPAAAGPLTAARFTWEGGGVI